MRPQFAITQPLSGPRDLPASIENTRRVAFGAATAAVVLSTGNACTLADVLGAKLRTAAERLAGLPECHRLYRAAEALESGTFAQRALRALNVSVRAAPSQIGRIPKLGPLLVVANHPLGGLDGLALLDVVCRVRSDLRLMANRWLGQIPALREDLLEVDVFGDAAPRYAANVSALRQASRWLRDGGALVVFPAGEVSSFAISRGGVADGPWSASVAWLAQSSGATVLPVFIEGRNSFLFQAAGMIHPALRTLLLPREMLRRRGRSVHLRIGTPIPASEFSRFETRERAARYLRARAMMLGRQTLRRIRSSRALELIAPAEAVEALGGEIAALPADRTLATSGSLRVFWARRSEIPAVVREVGRLREITFRAVGEGTGRTADLDTFDDHYLHLVLWDEAGQQIAGSYRLGLTDEILACFGPEGLYTRSLFDYGPPVLEKLRCGIELGRSFVREEYQKEYAPLMLLWKGIARFIAAHPRYRVLYGTVSISNEYSSLTRSLLAAFLRINCEYPDLMRHVRARRRPRFGWFRRREAELAAVAARDMDDVDRLVAELENGRRAPVLVRQYLKLNARLLGFNVDPDFGDTLDALMMVDLLELQPAVLVRYMGGEGYRSFCGHWGRQIAIKA